MKAKELIARLQEIVALNPDSTVFINGSESDYVDFTGFSCDDVCDVQLYEVAGDEAA